MKHNGLNHVNFDLDPWIGCSFASLEGDYVCYSYLEGVAYCRLSDYLYTCSILLWTYGMYKIHRYMLWLCSIQVATPSQKKLGLNIYTEYDIVITPFTVSVAMSDAYILKTHPAAVSSEHMQY